MTEKECRLVRRLRSNRAFWPIVIWSIGVVGACVTDEIPGPQRTSTAPFDSAAFRAKFGAMGVPSLNTIKVTGGDSIEFSPGSYHCSQSCDAIPPNTGPITVVLPRRATTVAITTFGPFKCSGTLPVVAAYDSVGHLLSSVTLLITNPPDCADGDDDMSNHLNGGVSHPSGTIAYLVISPPSPWTWQVPDGTGGTLTARAFIDYTITITQGGVTGAPPPNCPATGDLILDSPGVREALVNEWDLSFGENKERTGWIYRDDSNGQYVVLFDPGAQRTRCTTWGRNYQVFPGLTPVATYHTHIVPPGALLTCPERPWDARAIEGPGFHDFVAANTTFPDGNKYKQYVIDAFKVYRTLPDANAYTAWIWFAGNHCR